MTVGLDDAAGKITATCDFNFRLWGQLASGIERGTSPDPHYTVSVNDGPFTVGLDLGPDAFPGEKRFLEIEVCCPSGALRAG